MKAIFEEMNLQERNLNQKFFDQPKFSKVPYFGQIILQQSKKMLFKTFLRKLICSQRNFSENYF